MARLFVGPREMNFISDITKEVIKDVNGQKIYLYSVSELKTMPHDVYNEAIDKIYDNPIAVDALVDAQYQEETVVNQFGVDSRYKIEAFIQYRDLVDKGFAPNIGDFFSYSDVMYEVTNTRTIKYIFGQAENKDGVVLTGVKAREGQFVAKFLGPTDIKYTDEDAVQKTFVQQRGSANDDDKRDLVTHGVIDPPLSPPAEVSPRGATGDGSGYESSFYGDEE